jgi:arylamine N-acetyltransferase
VSELSNRSPPSSLGPATRLAIADRALMDFAEHFRLRLDLARAELLREVCRGFARLPYENLTKIVKHDRVGRLAGAAARRGPVEVIADHIAWGAGGTCFSLSNTLRHILQTLGWKAEIVLADRSYGTNTHCAVVVDVDGSPRLIDPGYLMVEPVSWLGTDAVRFDTSFNGVLLRPSLDQRRLELYTISRSFGTADRPPKEHARLRLTYRLDPADEAEFLAAWDASFDQEMMTYPVVTRADAQGQFYVQGNRVSLRTRDAASKEELGSAELPGRIARELGLEETITASALAILERRGVRG